MKSAAARAGKIKQLSKTNVASRRLARTGYLPQAAYAMSNQSLTYKQRKGLRNGCLRACGVSIRSWCLATAIRLMWNEERDPTWSSSRLKS